MVHPLVLLYGETETTFPNNGFGSLGEAISCTVTEERNGMFELEMEYPIYGKRFAEILKRRIIYTKSNPFSNPQAFRIYQITKTMSDTILVNASHISYDLDGYLVNPFESENCTEAFTKLKSNIIEMKEPFTFWTDNPTVNYFHQKEPTNIRSVLGDSGNGILAAYIGEYEFDNFTVRLHENRGQDLGVTIKYGKNLTDFKQEENISNVYTAIYPYYQDSDTKEFVTLPEKTISTSVTAFSYYRVTPVNLTSRFDGRPTVEQLREEAKKYVEKNPDLATPAVNMDVSFVQLAQCEEYEMLAVLEQVHLCDTLTVEFPELGISTKEKVTKTVYDALKGTYSSVTIGEVKDRISDTVAEQEEKVKTDIQEATTTWDQNLSSSEEKMGQNLKDTEEKWDQNLSDTSEEWNQNLSDTEARWDENLTDATNTWDKNLSAAKTQWNTDLSSAQGEWKRNLDDATDTWNREVKNLDGELDKLGLSVDSINGSVNTLSGQVSGVDKRLTNFQNQVATDIQNAVANSTNWITNGKGYVVGIKDSAGNWKELCILDTPNINTAQKVWRWNSGGLGYSSTGYSGPYRTAITADGGIVADFIKTGALNANLITTGYMAFGRIRGGTLMLGGSNYGYGQLQMYNTKNKLVATINGDYFQINDIDLNGNMIAVSNRGVIGGCDIRLFEAEFGSTPNISSGYTIHMVGNGIFLHSCGVYFRPGDYAKVVAGSQCTFFRDLSGSGTGILNYYAGLMLDSNGRGVYVDKLKTVGEKTRVVDTKSYGKRLQYCYETPTPMFGDIGSGVLDENGLCYIYLDDIFAETVSDISEYHVFLQKEGPGDLWVKKREQQYFIVEGTPNLPFSFEIKAFQRGYELERLESDPVLDYEEPEYTVQYEEEMKETQDQSLRELEPYQDQELNRSEIEWRQTVEEYENERNEVQMQSLIGILPDYEQALDQLIYEKEVIFV